jgi:D-3-phosphoglycerate dehydrogenase
MSSTARNIHSTFKTPEASSNANTLSPSPNYLSLSVSPTISSRSATTYSASSKQLKPFNTTDIRILLLENVNETAQKILKEQGYQVEFCKSSLSEDALIEKIRYVPFFFKKKKRKEKSSRTGLD